MILVGLVLSNVFIGRAKKKNRIMEWLKRTLKYSYFIRIYEESFLLLFFVCLMDINAFNNNKYELPGFLLSALFAPFYIFLNVFFGLKIR